MSTETAETIEKRKTRNNYKSEIRDARVIANYGDPGIDEDYHFDILSRYVVVMFESCQRIITKDKWSSMLAVVKRPESLWINCVGTPSDTASQQRTDTAGNTNVGLAGGYSTNGISRISPAYSFGEVIKVRKMPHPIQPNNTFFQSAFSLWNTNTWAYGGWHSDGSSLPYFSDDQRKTSLRQKTIEPISASSNFYRFFLHKYQWEAFALQQFLGNQQVTSMLESVFQNTWGGNQSVYTGHGGYLFSQLTYILINSIGYEDMNIAGKARVADNQCVPLIVATPNTFPIPSQRAIGTIQYNPTYSPIAR